MEPNFQPSPPQDKPTDEEPAVVSNQEKVSEQVYFDDQALPKLTSEDARPVQPVDQPATPDAFGPAPYGSQPATPAPSLSGQDATSSATVTQGPVVPVQPAKKSKLWLWVTIGAALLIVLSLIAGYFVVKGAADATAQSYTVSVKEYVDDVYDAATSPAASPSDIVKEIDDIKAPTLNSALMSGVSAEYGSAEALQIQAKEKVGVLTEKMKEYAQVEEFYTDYQGLYASLQVLDAKGAAAIKTRNQSLVSSYLKEFHEKLEEIDALIDDADFSGALAEDVEELGRVHGVMSTNWGKMVSAFDSNNSPAYKSAFDDYADAAGDLADTKKPIVDFFGELSSKSQDAADELKDYRETLQ